MYPLLLLLPQTDPPAMLPVTVWLIGVAERHAALTGAGAGVGAGVGEGEDDPPATPQPPLIQVCPDGQPMPRIFSVLP